MDFVAKVILLLFFPLLTIAQETAPVVQSAKKNPLDVTTGFRLSLKTNNLHPQDDVFHGDPLGREDVLNFAIHGDIYLVLGSKVNLQTGFSFQPHRLRYNDSRITVACDYYDNQGNFIAVLAEKSTLSYNTKILYLGIPLAAKIKLREEEDHLYTRFGLEFLFNLQQKEAHYFQECGYERDALLSEPEGIKRKGNATIHLGLGYEFFMYDQQVFIEPMIAYTLIPVELRYAENYQILDQSFKARSYQMGVQLGMLF